MTWKNGFVIYETKKGRFAEGDQLDKLREMARRSRRRHTVGRTIKYVIAAIAVVTLCLLELAIRRL